MVSEQLFKKQKKSEVMGNVQMQRKYQKALEALVYIANKDERLYWILKTIYFADKEHLSKHGRQIFGDYYRAMKQGPVPSLAYDIVKCVRGNGWFAFSNPAPSTVLGTPDRYTVTTKRPPNTNFFSKSEIESLNNAYELVKNLSFNQLKELSHDEAYKAVEQDEEMSLESIALTLGNGQEVLSYLQEA